MTKITALALLAAVLAGAAQGAEVDRAALAKKQDVLGAEYSLAKEANFYFVFDVLGKKIELRVRGMVLKTWPVETMRFWGRPDFSGTVELIRKTALKAPERIVIKPGESEAAAPAAAAAAPKPAAGSAAASADYDLEALELRDMPRRFGLDLSNGLHISVRTKAGSARSLMARMKDALRWYIGLPLRNLFGPRDGKGLAELELVFADDKDPQSLYWHLFDGIKGIVL